jgi:hypothetical protein
VIFIVPGELIILNNLGQFGSIGKEKSQVRGQDAVFNIPQHLYNNSIINEIPSKYFI